MLRVIRDANVIFYLMLAVGIVGILAKSVSRASVKRLLRASAGMQKSTHRLMKLVRAKYEHACLAHNTVDNTEVFVERFLYEYRPFAFRLCTWQQIQKQCLWLTALLTGAGVALQYSTYGAGEGVYQYAALGAAEIILLAAVFGMTNEQERLRMVQIYMVDYLENIHAHRHQKLKAYEKEKLDIINPEVFAQPLEKTGTDNGEPEKMTGRDGLAINIEETPQKAKKEDVSKKRLHFSERKAGAAKESVRAMLRNEAKEEKEAGQAQQRNLQKGQTEIAAEKNAAAVKTAENKEADETAVKVEAIRHILEEFLA